MRSFRALQPVALLTLAAAIAGCGPMPDLRGGFAPPVLRGAPAPVAAAPATAAPSAAAAERACAEAARARGLAVRAVSGSREVTGEAGAALGRDVMLRVERPGQVFDLRCRFAYESGEARIMAL